MQTPYSKNDSISVNGIREITIDANASVEVRRAQTGTLDISISGKSSYTPDYSVISANSTVTVEFNKAPKFGVNISLFKMIVTIPEFYTEDIQIIISSGGIDFNASEFKTVNLKTTSGGIHSPGITCHGLNAKATSGGIDIGTVRAEQASFMTSSGGIKIERLNCGKARLECGSGAIKIDEIIKTDIDAKCKSGGIKAAFSDYDNDIRMSCSSGGIELALPDDANFNLDVKAVSGSIKNDFARRSVQNENRAAHRIVLNTVSGGIKVIARQN